MSPQEITQLLANWGKVRSDGVVRGRLRAGVDSLSRVGSIGFYTSLAGEPLFRGALPDD